MALALGSESTLDAALAPAVRGSDKWRSKCVRVQTPRSSASVRALLTRFSLLSPPPPPHSQAQRRLERGWHCKW